uniref:Uncharacterized protein n=1 Tax=Trichobilharzia regenti TaxID=157069 RepID=A0AA85K7V4_TRIRE|nr:unnamed protein product [Trichobilharzia regenti]
MTMFTTKDTFKCLANKYIQIKQFSMFIYLCLLTIILPQIIDQFKISSSVNGQNILRYEPNYTQKQNKEFTKIYDNYPRNYSMDIANTSSVNHLPVQQHNTMKNSWSSDWFENRIMRKVHNQKNNYDETFKPHLDNEQVTNPKPNLHSSSSDLDPSTVDTGYWDEDYLDMNDEPEYSHNPLEYINIDKILERDRRQVSPVAHYILSPLINNPRRSSAMYHPSLSYLTSPSSTRLNLKKSMNQRLLNRNTENDIFNFVFQFVRYNQTSMDLIAAFNLIFEWERYKLMQQLQIQREQKLKLLRYKQEHRRLDEYRRYLRHFSTKLTNEKAKQFKNVQSFYDFKKIIVGAKGVKGGVKSNRNNVRDNRKIVDYNDNVIHSRVDLQSLGEQHKSHDSTSSSNLYDMQFSGGIGGGIFADSLRLRKANSREGRAIISGSSSSDGQNTLKTSLETEFSHVFNRNDSEEELKRAFESYQEFKMVSCQPQNHTLCTEAFLRLNHNNQQEHQHHNTALIIPRGIHVQRCGQPEISRCNYYSNQFTNDEEDYEFASVPTLSSNSHTSYDDQYLEILHDRNQHASCNCETLEEECLPLKVSLKTYAVAVMQIAPFENFKHSTESIVLTNHLECGCQPRCSNRLCIPPLKFIMHTFSDCACVCPSNDKRCFELLEGKRQFTVEEIPLPLNGSYILPPCRYGVMDDLHLYHRRCPGPVRSTFPNK